MPSTHGVFKSSFTPVDSPQGIVVKGIRDPGSGGEPSGASAGERESRFIFTSAGGSESGAAVLLYVCLTSGRARMLTTSLALPCAHPEGLPIKKLIREIDYEKR